MWPRTLCGGGVFAQWLCLPLLDLPAQFRATRGSDGSDQGGQYLLDEPKYFVSSADGKRGFCGHCGSRIVWQALREEDEWLTNLSVGCLDNPAEARMTRHIYADTQLPWYKLCEDLPKLVSGDLDQLTAMLRHEVGLDS